MPKFEVNKGVGKPVEFMGLQAQYIGYLFGGAFGNFILFAIIYLLGTPPFISLLYLIVSSGFLAYYIFSTGKKHGAHGLRLLSAKKAQPRYMVCRNPLLFKNLKSGNQNHLY
ncbi:DUF4133 domain-containing protein [Rhodocytophaga aerolata]|uniref:DUF4133 domain-containing protein n=1 Tax=Rhodocytophaga aerolata TaxID=455078 RepID=A0ABT8RF53_9BACT|nr:DUF4133 domain-containing protein [Rhodocytophaga aerolata]MDO1450741.1 DUF4133 domain-containing protein [Rhodocytophaga aerolata]